MTLARSNPCEGAEQVGYTVGSFAVWKRDDFLFQVVHDARGEHFILPVDSSQIVHHLNPPIPWHEPSRS